MGSGRHPAPERPQALERRWASCRVDVPVERGKHPTQKPERLVTDWIEKFSNSGELVLDPFMGSGTTGVAAAKRGRRFIGIERDPKYFEIACQRIAQAIAQSEQTDNARRTA